MKKYLFMFCALMCALVASATKYTKVTSVADLHDGDVVLMVNEAAGKVSADLAGKYINAATASIANGVAELDGATEIVLSQSGSNWTMKCGGKVVGTISSGDLSTNSSAVKTYTISFESNGNVNITCTNTAYGKFFYNATGSGRFKTYTSNTMSPIQLYKKVAGSNPTLTLSATEIVFDTKALSAEGVATDSKTLTVTAADLKAENLQVSVTEGSIFSVSSESLPANGGELTVSYSAVAEGNYTATLTVRGTTMDDEPIQAQCALSVVIDEKAPTGTEVTYNLLQNMTDLSEGDKVFIGTAAKDYVLGQYNYSQSSSNIHGVSATYDEKRHKVTANDLYVYTVSIVDGKYVFTGTDGKALCDYNAAKNLSSTETIDNKAKWTVNITEDVASIKNVYASSYSIYFNKTASAPLFCCYNSSPATDANVAVVYLYSNNAPEYKEKELHPAMDVMIDGQMVGDELDWGYVEYDNSWGTDYPPYSQSMTLTIVGTDLEEEITLALQKGTAFTCYTEKLPAKGGTASVQFETNSVGAYTDVLTIRCGEIVKTIQLKATAVKDAPDTDQPTLTLSTEQVAIQFATLESMSDMDMFTFSAEKLAKKLYVNWVKNNTEPTIGYGKIEILVGDQQIQAGESATFDGPTVPETEVYISVDAYAAFDYSTTLDFYSLKADSKTERAIDKSVELDIQVTTTPTGAHEVRLTVDGQRYNLQGQVVGDAYRGIVIQNGQKCLR